MALVTTDLTVASNHGPIRGAYSSVDARERSNLSLTDLAGLRQLGRDRGFNRPQVMRGVGQGGIKPKGFGVGDFCAVYQP